MAPVSIPSITVVSLLSWNNLWKMLKNKGNIFAATWMDLEGIMLSEINQTEKDTVSNLLHVESEKCNWLVNITAKNRLGDTEDKLVMPHGDSEGGGGRWGRRWRGTIY